MQQAFCIAKNHDTFIDLGNTKKAVGNRVIKGSISVEIEGNFKDIDVDVSKNASIIVRISQFLLMLTIVLSVTMTIINGIQYIVKSGNGEDPSKTRMNLVYIVVGILVALFSVVIINVFRSVGESTLKEIGYSSPTILEKNSDLV